MNAAPPLPEPKTGVNRLRELLAGLNEQQLEAATIMTGPALVLAGAGSGKTKVMTQRIAVLLEQGVHPSEILAVTFTNKAAREMAARLQRLTPHLKQQPLLCTFHSFCVRLLRKHMEMADEVRDGKFTIYDADQSERTVKEAIKALNFDPKEWSAAEQRQAISGAKNRGLTPNDTSLFRYIEIEQIRDQMRAIYRKYEELLRANNAVDFDDLLLLTVRLLRRNDILCHQYHRLFRHISVDEFQDTNNIQARLIDLLALDGKPPEAIAPEFWNKPERSLFLIGDDMQAIYSFRGSDVSIIRNYPNRYRAQVVTLEQNYRSSNAILSVGNQLSAQAGGQFKKILRSNKYEGKAPAIKVYESSFEEADDVARLIAEGLRQPHMKCAVLYRTTAQARAFEDALRKRGIPYALTGGTSFFDRAEIKDILAYVGHAQNPKNNALFKRIINLPKRGVGDTALVALEDVSITHLCSLTQAASLEDCPASIKPATWKKIKAAKAILDQTTGILLDEGKKLAERLKAVIALIGYEKHLEATYDDWEGRLENVYELISAAATLNDGDCTLEEFLDYASLNTNQKEEVDGSTRVFLSTIHAAKGLEWSLVVVAGVEENFLPHINAIKNNEIDEELRLFYVAVTRAEEELYMTLARRRMVFGDWQMREGSRFLQAINVGGS